MADTKPGNGSFSLEMPAVFAARLGLSFDNISLLMRALTHRSYINENQYATEDNERLEFFGDAVLDYLVAAWLYKKYPEMREGRLTRLRAALVDTRQLSAFARQIKIGDALRLGRGEDEGGGRERDSLLCGAFEALIGAIALDAGLPAVEAFYYPFIADIADTIVFGHTDKDAKSHLQEWSQGQGMGIPAYEVIETEGPDHAKMFRVAVKINGDTLAYGEDFSKRKATMDAARNALDKLGLD